MISLALEIPTAYLRWWSPLTDIDFALAHQILKSSDYAKFFAAQPEGREILMDNSFHELGTPLPISDLAKAARLCNATYVVAPDKLGEPIWNENQFHATKKALPNESVVPVMSGRNPEERRLYLQSVRASRMLLLPYREQRLTWFHEQGHLMVQNWKRIHLLGVSTLEELRAFVGISELSPDVLWSVDTAKPVKLGVIGRRIDDGAPLRGLKLTSKDLLDLKGLALEQVRAIELNIQILRAVCNGEPA
jgi:hypothetical protein